MWTVGRFRTTCLTASAAPLARALFRRNALQGGPDAGREVPAGRAVEEALAEVALQPHGEQVCSVTLAWERPNGSGNSSAPAWPMARSRCRPGTTAYTSAIAGERRPARPGNGLRHSACARKSRWASPPARRTNCVAARRSKSRSRPRRRRPQRLGTESIEDSSNASASRSHVADQRESRRCRRGDLLSLLQGRAVSIEARPSLLSASCRLGARPLPPATWSLGEVAPAGTHGEYPRIWLARKSP